MIKEHKIKTIKYLKKTLKNIRLLIILNIHEMRAEDLRILRKMLNENHLNIKVFKNKLSKYAIKDSPFSSISDDLKGQTAFVWDVQSSPVAAKVLKDFREKIKDVKIICGFHDGVKVNTEYLEYLSNIPDMHSLRLKLLNILAIISRKIVFNIKYQSLAIINILKHKKC